MVVKSLRWRLQLWHGLVLVLVLAGFGFTAYHLAQLTHFRRIDAELQVRVTALGGALRRPGPGPMRGERPPPEDFRPPGGEMPPPRDFRLPEHQRASYGESATNGFYFIVWRRDGEILSSSSRDVRDIPLPSRDVAEHGARMRGAYREFYMFTPPGECILAGRSIATEMAEIRQLAWLLSGAGAGVLLLGLAGGWWFSTRAIRPIAEISSAARKIAAGDLSQRIQASDRESELGNLTETLNATFARLEDAFAQQARFTADASHELRTPVSVILSQAQLALARERTPAEYQEALKSCQRAAQRMRELIESLLQLARLDAGQEHLHAQPLDLAATTRECVEMIHPLADQAEIKITCDLQPALSTGDPKQMAQVITNLLSNAIDFNRRCGEVRVSTTTNNGQVSLTVADTGQGISSEDLPHLFERFYRADKSRSRSQGRNGLGLAICKAIVDAHHGKISVASEPGKGSSFTVELPGSARL